MDTTKRKTVLLLLFFSIHSLLLAGCWDRTEVNDLAIITAAGIDLTEDRYPELSVNIYVTSQSGTGGQQIGGMSDSSGGGANVSVVRSAPGLTLADATSKLQRMLPRKVFWGHDEVFIFGERLAKQGIGEPIEFLTRHPAPRERGNVFVSKGLAKDVLMLPPSIERTIADKLREVAKSQTGLNITLKELAQMMAGKSKAAIVPWLEIQPGFKNQTPFPFIMGSAVLKNGKMVGRINEYATRGVMWLRNEINLATITFSPKNTQGYVSFELKKSSTALVPHIDGDNWSITARIETLNDIVENTTDLNLMEPNNVKELETELGNDIEHRMKLALTKAQNMNADIFGFADAFYRKYPKAWKRAQDRWDEIFPKLKVKLETRTVISRPGMTGKSIIKPE
ncbi:germination protein [Paenibacillus cisolokensis]|uniref:Germination protein n=1 Tax=Paenibacillus cisolokensis TaxID=1658519 RepID=A0ABQ4N3N9_9BACL|nr:Ger(x)C family spore germination protein [Paenibacillus cisolokensis]GIQ62778.1 germination protein [Paenibacillus cisolokensis]